jgi:hypothetical protein
VLQVRKLMLEQTLTSPSLGPRTPPHNHKNSTVGLHPPPPPCALRFASSRGVLKMSLLQAHGVKLVLMLLLVAVRGAGSYSMQSKRSSCSSRYNTPCNSCCKCTPLFLPHFPFIHSSPYPHLSVTPRSVIATVGPGPPLALLLSCRCASSFYPCICVDFRHKSHYSFCKHRNRRSVTT